MKRWSNKIPMFVLFAAAGALAIGAIVMVLWNAIMPQVFHAGTITLLQAAGLLVLARLLFGGFRKGGGRGGRHGRHRMGEWRGAGREEHATETSNFRHYTAAWQMQYNPESAL